MGRKIHEPNRGGVLSVNRRIRHADFQGQARHGGIEFRHVGIAFEAVFAWLVASLNLDQSHIEARILVARKRQSAGDVNGADRLIGVHIIGDRVARTNLNQGPGSGHLAILPGLGIRPRPALDGTKERRGFVLMLAGQAW